QGAHEQEAQGVAEGVGRAAAEAVGGDLAGGADAGLGAEPGGEDREGGEGVAEAAPGQQKVLLAADATRDPQPEGELTEDVGDDAEEQHVSESARQRVSEADAQSTKKSGSSSAPGVTA